jgi:hypothetical protein
VIFWLSLGPKVKALAQTGVLWLGISSDQAKHAGFGLTLAWLWLKPWLQDEKKGFVL